MEVKNKITLDLQNIDATPLLFAKQGDAGSRSVEITLTDNRALWPVPSSAAILIRYRKASGAAGMYDTLPDGKRLYSGRGKWAHYHCSCASDAGGAGQCTG